MGGKSSKPNSSRSRNIVLHDEERASEARAKTDFVDPRSLVDKLQPGDLVQVKGNNIHRWFFRHFAVCYGNGQIIHVKAKSGEYKILQDVMVEKFKGRLIRKNNLMDNKRYFHAKQPREIAKRARSMIGQSWHYNFFTNNCEHFATLEWNCRYHCRLTSFLIFKFILSDASQTEVIIRARSRWKKGNLGIGQVLENIWKVLSVYQNKLFEVSNQNVNIGWCWNL